jgi:hypothetical protein
MNVYQFEAIVNFRFILPRTIRIMVANKYFEKRCY